MAEVAIIFRCKDSMPTGMTFQILTNGVATSIFEELFNRYYNSLVLFAMKYVKLQDIAEDIHMKGKINEEIAQDLGLSILTVKNQKNERFVI